MNTGKRLVAGFLFFAGIALLFLIWIFENNSTKNTLPLHYATKLESLEAVSGGTLIHTIQLPADFEKAQSVLYETTHTITEVRLDEVLLYQYGREADAPAFLKSPGSLWHLVDIPEGSAGKTLEIRIIPVYDGYYGNTAVFFGGSRAACVTELFESFLPVLIINCIILFAGALSILLHFTTSHHWEKDEVGGFCSAGIFALLIAVWSLCQCGFLQFLIPDARTLYFVNYFSFYLFPVPFNLFVYDIIQTKYRKGLLWTAGAYLVNMAAALFLQCAGITDIFLTLPATHLLMVFNVVYIILVVHYEAKKEDNKTAKRFQLPLYTMMIFAAAELVLYYVHGFRETSVFLPAGAIVFIAMLIQIQVIRYHRRIEGEKLAYFKKLANIDVLTEALNRNAYENTVKYLEEQKVELQTTGVVLIDLDDMKYINDNFGHEKGDEALKYCYQCICQAFGADRHCFRIGGDEFAYVFHTHEKPDIEKEIEAFEQLIEERNKTLPYPFSAAVGYACYMADTDLDFKDLVRRSDMMMYRKKRKRKLMKAADVEQLSPDLKKGLLESVPEEIIFHEKKYQEIPLSRLCAFIDLLSPSTDDFLYVLDFQTDFYYIAPHALQRFNLEANSFHEVTAHLKSLIYEEDYPRLNAEIEDLMNSTTRSIHNMQYRWLDVNRKPVWINCRGYVVRDDDGKALYMIGCINEIGTRQKADNVSGLLGEFSLQEYLAHFESGFPDGYLMRLGIDNFKEINEKFGIEYGDMILRETAACISRCLPDGLRLYKLVADEFMILNFAGGSQTDAAALFDRIREELGQFVADNGFEVIFTISGGILLCSSLKEHTYSNVMKLSEFSLNEAKAQGRNRCHIFCLEEYNLFLRRRELTRILRKSVNHGFEGFDVYYQPLFRSDTNLLYGAEALMRFSSKECGTVSPGEFIPILEKSGLILPLGRWILREALKKCRCIREQIPDFQISVNISHVQVSKTNLLSEILAAVKDAEVPASALIIELTESGLLEANQDAAKLWSDLDACGVKLALDDFGTGYANFHYLSELKPDIIKIDRSFVAKALKDDSEYYLLFLLCSMTHNLKLKLCIEGVENEGEWEKIRDLHPDYSQGYFWGRPCPYDKFSEQFVTPTAREANRN